MVGVGGRRRGRIGGLLRQYLPRKLDLAEFGQIELDQIAAELNGRPRKTLDWATPAERVEALLR